MPYVCHLGSCGSEHVHVHATSALEMAVYLNRSYSCTVVLPTGVFSTNTQTASTSRSKYGQRFMASRGKRRDVCLRLQRANILNLQFGVLRCAGTRSGRTRATSRCTCRRLQIRPRCPVFICTFVRMSGKGLPNAYIPHAGLSTDATDLTIYTSS